VILLTAILAIVGGESVAVVFGAFTPLMWIELAQVVLKLTPVLIAVVERLIPVFAGVGKLVATGVEDVVVGTFMSEGFKQWVIANGDGAIKMQDQRDKDY